MAYLKPQSPLQHKDGDYFYPITTADQVIMDDGSRLNASINKGSSSTNIVLAHNLWVDNEQIVSVDGVTATNTIFVGSDLGSEPTYTDCGVYCSGQGEGTLTFKCSTIPSEDVIANAVIL